MIELFRWATSNEEGRYKGKLKVTGSNHFYFPSASGTLNQNYLGQNCAVYYRATGVISMEISLVTPYEWHNTQAMTRQTGAALAELFGGGKYLYYTDQPVKGRRGATKGTNLYFQQFCTKVGEPPKPETLIRAWEIMQEAPIEGAVCGEYKYHNCRAGTTPKDRTYKKLQSISSQQQYTTPTDGDQESVF